ncbi:arginyltransferase 1 isoform X4 [Lasioglossum baleicum]|uniref:arginyltransferase 1 isoform X4 n=1 Tax=Lasioglossum baleicum TaxID=434251 RepID=UPI003FCD7D76
MAKQSYSIVVYYAKKERGMCGYCKNTNMSFTSGMQAVIMEVQDYQALIDRGWRRSARYCYKPCMDQICCPSYTIKCEALNFKITKSQKKVLKRMGKFLRNELQKDDLMDTSEEERDNTEIGHIAPSGTHLEEAASEIKVKAVDDEIIARLQPTISDKGTVSDPGTQQKQPESIPRAANQNENCQAASRSLESVEMNPTRGPCKKAKLLRIERKQKKLLAQGKTQAEIDAMFKKDKQQNQGKSLEELFDEMLNGTSRLEPWIPEDGPPCGYGAFHEQYWLDNELIAVGVIDILPFCVSSVYFFYDPAYSFLSLGTLSSLREVYLTRQLNKSAKDLQYYYMGFYIHSCPKMRYKARMKPSKLLCPETYEWFDIDSCIKKLDKEKYCRFNENLDAIDQDAVVDADKVLVLYRHTAMPFRIYRERVQQPIAEQEEEKKEVEEFATLVGMKCAQRMLLYRT